MVASIVPDAIEIKSRAATMIAKNDVVELEVVHVESSAVPASENMPAKAIFSEIEQKNANDKGIFQKKEEKYEIVLSLITNWNASENDQKEMEMVERQENIESSPPNTEIDTENERVESRAQLIKEEKLLKGVENLPIHEDHVLEFDEKMSKPEIPQASLVDASDNFKQDDLERKSESRAGIGFDLISPSSIEPRDRSFSTPISSPGKSAQLGVRVFTHRPDSYHDLERILETPDQQPVYDSSIRPRSSVIIIHLFQFQFLLNYLLRVFLPPDYQLPVIYPTLKASSRLCTKEY
jgi:hypothetical protein